MTRAAILLALLALLATGCDPDGPIIMAGDDSPVSLLVENQASVDLVLWRIGPDTEGARQLRDLPPRGIASLNPFALSREAQRLCEESDPRVHGGYEVRTLDGDILRFIEARFCDDDGDVILTNVVTITPDMLLDAN